MKRTIIASLALLGLGAALSACAPADKAADATAAAKRMPLPDCSTVKTKDAGPDGWIHPDCRLMLPDQSGIAIEARYTPAEDDSTKITIQVVGPGDATMQTFEERMDNTFEGIKAEDFDKDGKLDIWVPLSTGNVNTDWALFRQVGTGKNFVRVGQVSGVDTAMTADGYLSVAGRSSANEWGVAFYKLDGDTLKLITTADVTAKGEPDKITGVDCVLDQDGADLAVSGLDAKAAQAKFCAEPSVTKIFK